MAFIVLFSWVALPTILKRGGQLLPPPLHVCFENIYLFDGSQAMDADGKDILSFILHLKIQEIVLKISIKII